ncbi:L-type lectin-domain containing receptor kinase IX.1-like [Mercurialis annua]|uniref:L-type lectin-domain containing receptor kinase IX.1-like n=1 Tax=Mercurialis annua TaxID=3986 RepID=UPI00215EF375|nr:L-type lectin-domain containing receptor kinase IX.1-like [Mercurialis annua]
MLLLLLLPFRFSILFILISVLTPRASGLSFNFTGFSAGDLNITYERAFPANQTIQLTTNTSFGRATYHKALQLYDKGSGNLTNFQTHFSFVINSENRSTYGDGLAFFLAPEGSKLPRNLTNGISLGLASDNQELNTTLNDFVAVEFDIFSNYIDPLYEHVGIDLKSMRSENTVHWLCDIQRGLRTDAWISYNSSSLNLSVAFTGFQDGTLVMQHLSEIVDLRQYLPERVTFGFSASTGGLVALHSIHSWEFSSALGIDDNLVPENRENEQKQSTKGKMLAIGLGVSGAFVGLVCLVVIVTVYWKKSARDEEEAHVLDEYIDDEFEKGTGPKRFPYHELARATNNFKDEHKLGQGGFGGVYKGFLKSLNINVAVKRVSRGSQQGVKEYAAEVKTISRLRHRNLVQLIGWCHERKELLLVYELLPNGSLDSHLFKESGLLTWDLRYKIAQGLASGLLYLHEEWEQCVVHRDIKSSNIMLDSNFSAKLGDFGLARLVDHGKGSQTTVLAGTMGYMAPECATTGKASRESDVYSFGIVALEIACGRKPIEPNANEDEVYVVKWIWNLYGRRELLQAADPRLGGEFDEQNMERLMIVGLWCAHPDENLRPSIRQAIHVLNNEAPLPILPPEMPVPSYFAPAPFNISALALSYSTTDSSQSQYQSSQFIASSAASSTSHQKLPSS